MAINVTGTGAIVRHSIVKGQSFTGQASDDIAPTIVDGVIEHALEPVPSGEEFISSAVVTVGGANYEVGDLPLVAGGTFTVQAQIEVLAVDGSGAITAFAIREAGVYTVAPGGPQSLSGGSGTAGTITATFVAVAPGGLISLRDYIERTSRLQSDKRVTVFWIKVLIGGTVAWSISVTDGKRRGGGGVASNREIDDPADDALLLSGTGSVATYVSMELAPYERLRLTSGAVETTEGVFQVHFIPVQDTLGRPLN